MMVHITPNWHISGRARPLSSDLSDASRRLPLGLISVLLWPSDGDIGGKSVAGYKHAKVQKLISGLDGWIRAWPNATAEGKPPNLAGCASKAGFTGVTTSGAIAGRGPRSPWRESGRHSMFDFLTALAIVHAGALDAGSRSGAS